MLHRGGWTVRVGEGEAGVPLSSSLLLTSREDLICGGGGGVVSILSISTERRYVKREGGECRWWLLRVTWSRSAVKVLSTALQRRQELAAVKR